MGTSEAAVDKGKKGTRRHDTSRTILGAPPIEPHVQARDSLPLSMSCTANSVLFLELI